MPLSLQQLKARLLAEHHAKPQNLSRIEHEFGRLGEALAALAALGHLYHLAEGSPGSGEVWPRLYFHVHAAPNGRVVNSRWELAELGPGWFPTLDEAQHDDGVATQFAGRGGVGRKSLPAVVAGAEVAVASLDERREAIKREFVARQRAAKAAKE